MNEPVTLISGTTRGIGRYLAQHYLDRGHQVVGCSRSTPEQEHENYRHFVLDVCDEAAVLAMFGAIRRDYPRLDNLINNAGIASMNHSLLTPLQTVRDILETNVGGTFLLCREAAKLMQKHRAGRIVNFTTVAVPLRLAGESAYVASKAAIEALTGVLARELGQYEITVNAVGPTAIDTDLIRNVPRAKIDSLLARQSIRRAGTRGDVANAVDFFLQPESGFVTGQTLYLGGV